MTWTNRTTSVAYAGATTRRGRAPRCAPRAWVVMLALGLATCAVAPRTAEAQAKPTSTKKDAKKAEEQERARQKEEEEKEKEAAEKARQEEEDARTAAAASAEEEAQAQEQASKVEPPKPVWDIHEVEELDGKTYLFVGARYRGNVIPAFLLDAFVDGGKTIYSSSFGVELDIRKNGFSLIPALSFTEYGTGDIVFKEKNTPDIPGNYNLVNSSMKAVYATIDVLWSTKLSKNLEFEYGAGFGLGVVFGDLVTNWVYRGPNGAFLPCQTEGQGGAGSGCNRADHQNADVARVGGYTEKAWTDGGSKPILFPWISIPQIGLRFKPIKQFVGRLGLGFGLTGFWFGLSGQYGLEREPKP